MTKKQAWIAAMRLRTLPLALACIILGTLQAAADGVANWLVAFFCFLTATLLQILSNLANDYGDAVHGADTAERVGPLRAVSSGLITHAEMKQGMLICGGLTAVSGLTLILLSFGTTGLLYVAIFAVLGGLSIWAAINYTAGKSPYGYKGLGDIMVLIFFGWVGVMGPYFLQAQTLAPLLFLPATACGLLAVGVLNINNTRDLDSDQKAGKITIPVRLGAKGARVYHGVLLGTAVLLATFYVILTYQSAWQFLYLLSLPLIGRNFYTVWTTYDSPKLNPMLKQMVLSTLVFVLTFGIGQWLA